MKTLNARDTICGEVKQFILTGAADGQTLASVTSDQQREQDRWQEFIDRRLIEWGRDSSSLEDEDIVPPSAEVIRLACQLAKFLRDKGSPAPLRVVPDGDGGIVFERHDGPYYEIIEINADGSIDWASLRNARLLDRQRLLEPRPH
jgi:hypothetical protein